MTLSEQIQRMHLRENLNSIYCYSKALSACMDMQENPQAHALALFCAESIVADAGELMDLVTDALNKIPPVFP